MFSRASIALRSAALASVLALAACGGDDGNLAEMDNALLGNGADPALTSALEDQILTDPDLTQQSNANAARPPERPAQAQYPAGSAGEVHRAAGGGAGGRVAESLPEGACGSNLRHGPEWAGRLPAEFPAYPGGRVTEAAGTDRGDCRVRVVTFRTRDPYNRVLEYYRSLASRAGFSAEHQVRGNDQLLGGVNQRSDGAFVVIVTPAQGGSEVALIVNNGR